jgi:hypothetical protein
MSDDDLLDFDRTRLGDWNAGRASRLLSEQGHLYRNHLAIAKWIDGWKETMNADGLDGDEQKGFVDALGEIAAHLRQGDFVVGGELMAGM